MTPSEPRAPAGSGRGAAALAVLVPMALAVVVGLPGAEGTFVRDDWLYVPMNALVSADTPAATIFRSPFHPDHALGLYRPLATLSLQWNWRGAGETAWPYHATNLVIAAAAAGLLAAFLLAWRVGPLAAALGAAAFAVHPARSEAVLWISARSELLMTAFALLALVIAERLRGPLRWPLCACAAVASAWSKEQGFVLVGLVPLLPGLSRSERLTGVLVTAVALGLAFAWRVHVIGSIGPEDAMQVLAGASRGDLAAFGLQALGRYGGLVFWPRLLVNEYDEPVAPASWPWMAAGVALVLLAPALLLLRRPRAAFAVLLFVIPLLPVLNVFYRTGEAFAERFLCLPVAGCGALLALWFAAVSRRWRAIAASVLAAIVLVLGARFFDRARDWRSQRELCEAQLLDAPELGGSWHLVAADLLDEFGLGQPEPADVARAGEYLTRALAIAPGRAEAARSLAKTHLRAADRLPPGDPRRESELRDAERLLRRALEVRPDLEQAHGMLGLVLVYLGRPAEAEPLLRKELALHPSELRATINLASLLEDARRPDEARRVREEGLDAALSYAAANRSESAPLRVAAQLSMQLGRKEEALDLARRALACRESPERRAAAAVDAAAILGTCGLEAEARAALTTTRSDLAAADAHGPSPELALALANLDVALGEPSRARAGLTAALPAARGLSERKIKAALAGLR